MQTKVTNHNLSMYSISCIHQGETKSIEKAVIQNPGIDIYEGDTFYVRFLSMQSPRQAPQRQTEWFCVVNHLI